MEFQKNDEKQSKEPYATPKLTVHGDVEKITKDIGVVATDGGQGSEVGDMK